MRGAAPRARRAVSGVEPRADNLRLAAVLAYRHQFHAGNFADVFKHALLTRLLLGLGRKDKPYLYLDTHAGIGLYDLQHPWAEKLSEYRDGIARVWERDDAPELLQPYLEAVRAENAAGKLRFYPGSPRIAQRLRRAEDRMALIELNKEDCARLERLLGGQAHVAVRCMDGYQALKAYLPPQERRGLVLVDSSFDRAGEYERLVANLRAAHERWASGVYALWYPLMEPFAVRGFERGVAQTGIRKILKARLSLTVEGWSETLRGCAMLIVNPPFGLEEEARQILDWLWRVLAPPGDGRWEVSWLAPE
jgi:23S rRNA (adenine2030-N6)-methyltransferase